MEPEEAVFEVLFRAGDAVYAVVVTDPVANKRMHFRFLSCETLQIRCALGSEA